MPYTGGNDEGQGFKAIYHSMFVSDFCCTPVVSISVKSTWCFLGTDVSRCSYTVDYSFNGDLFCDLFWYISKRVGTKASIFKSNLLVHVDKFCDVPQKAVYLFRVSVEYLGTWVGIIDFFKLRLKDRDVVWRDEVNATHFVLV